MEELKDDEYWTVVDGSGKFYMRCGEINAMPLYFGKDKELAMAMLDLELSRLSCLYNKRLKADIIKVSVKAVTD